MSRRPLFYPSIVQILLILNGIAFIFLIAASGPIMESFALWPLGMMGIEIAEGIAPSFHIWQLISYAFLHGSVFHLLINMYALWLFGSRIEYAWGSKAFAIYYFVCALGAGLVQLLIASQTMSEGTIYPTVGASGGVFGLLLAFALTFPDERLMLIFPPIILKAKWFVLLYAGVELYAGVTGTLAGIAHFAHLGGMLFGFLLLVYWGKHPLKP
ncbi:MAG: rhomboid family intramembrane serine protease [Gammaproteobacteria bacterium]|nr:rhomboid family intramembrane serine protease [Gammaproteobacteria bacterium]